MRKLLLIAAMAAYVASAAPTRIVDTVKYANNTNASGMVRIEWPAFTISGTAVAAGFVQVNIVNGVLDVSLQPTDLATPSGTVYTVRFYLQNSPVATEYWTVPTSATAVNLADVRTAPLSALSGLHDVSTSNDWTQISTPGTNPASGYLRVYAKTGSGICWLSSAGAETCADAGGGITSLNALTGATQTFAAGSSGSDFSISSSGSTHTFNLPSASGSNRGLLTAADWTTFNSKGDVSTGGSYSDPSWITGLAWSKITGAPVTSTTNGARVGSNDGVYLEPANPAVGFNAYYDGGWKFGNASPNNYASIITRDASGNLVFSVSSATGATGATPTFNSMTFSQSTRKLSGVTPGTAAGEVVALNGSNQVDLALIPTGTSSSTVALGDHTHTGVYEPANANIQSHISSTANPHSVTKTQVSLGNVDNYATASQVEAEEGTVAYKFMTPERTSQAITALQVFKAVGAGLTDTAGTVSVDNTAYGRKFTSSSADPGATACITGDYWVREDTDETWDCTDSTPTWTKRSKGTHVHAASDVTSGTLAVAQGGTGLASGTSGGVLAYTASGTLASSGALTANAPVIGGGAGAAPTVGTRSGNTTEFGTVTGAKTTGKQVQFDASGNLEASSSDIWGGGSSAPDPVWLPVGFRDTASSANRFFWGSTVAGGDVDTLGSAPNISFSMGLADAADNSIAYNLALPNGWTPGTLDIAVHWYANNASTNSVRFEVSTSCQGNGDAITTPSYNTASATSAANAGTSLLNITTFTSVDITGCAAGERMWIKVARDGDGTGGTDDLAVSARVLGAQVRFN